MREILFRGKSVDDGTLIEGDLSHCVVVGETHIRRIEDNLSTTTHRIDPETVCQYTGLTDKNGRKIFEGDIINDIDYGIMKCIYLHGSFVWYKEDGFKIECMKYVPVIEIIGNIFDNPELIDSNLYK